MFGNAYLRFGKFLFYGVVCFFVRVYEGEVGAKKFQRALFLRRPGGLEIGMRSDDVGFIERDPKGHVIPECVRHFFRIPREVVRESRREHAALSREPQGECPVPERDERLDVSRAKRANDILIVGDFLFVKFSLFGFDTRPLDGEAVRGVAQTPRDIEIRFVTMIVIDGNAGNIILGTGGFRAELLRPAGEATEFRGGRAGEAVGVYLFPLAPVIGRATLHLMRRGRRPPEEVVGKKPEHIDRN